MNFKKTWLVISREFSIRVKKKSFILTTIITPILFAALCIAPSLIMMSDLDNNVTRIAVVDNSGIVADNLHNTKKIEYVKSDIDDVNYLKGKLDSLGVDALVAFSALDEQGNMRVITYSSRQLNASVTGEITSMAEDIVKEYKIAQYDIPDFKKMMDELKTNVEINSFIINDKGGQKQASVEVNMGVSFIMGFIIYMFVTMFGNMVMTSVINEKSNKIVEVIVSSVKPFELMMGKIIGVASVALTQFFIWVILTLLLVFGGFAIMGQDLIGNPEAMSQMTNMVGMDAQGMANQMLESSGPQTFINSILGVNWLYIIVCFIIFFVLGYLLYASMFAAVGSCVDNEADTNQLVLPITIPLIIGMFIMIQVFQNPDSSLSFWGSLFPLTSPMVMMARIPFEGGVPMWELILSIGLLVVTIAIVIWGAAKIYRVGILMSGTKYTWKDIFKWLKY
ncbi:MAG: ABC transporter permease [Bacteroidales bacterium]|nr:ABC transporter permease [Bacteroidales bacterium]MDY5823450.1 ABC transporter permease [Candidatus Coprenecus sp.]